MNSTVLLKRIKPSLILFLALGLFIPSIILAQQAPSNPSTPPPELQQAPSNPSTPPPELQQAPSNPSTPPPEPVESTDRTQTNTTPGSKGLVDPLNGVTIPGLLDALLGVVIVIATPIIVFFIIFAGFKYVTARGNATQVQDATRALTYAIIGGVLVIGATAITTIITGLVDAFRG